MENVSRRQFIAAGLGVVVAGCTHTERVVTGRPRPLWPVSTVRPQVDGIVAEPPRVAPVAVPLGPLMVLPRDQWAKAKPLGGRLQKMGRIGRITVHHEGWTPVWFDDVPSTARRLEAIRRSHLSRLHAGDIGYHLIIDRGGQVWQGRDMCYQGAHVRDHNDHNVGIMLLGNFDLQRPTDGQIQALRMTVAKLSHRYEIPVKQVFTHQEFNVTSCPGKALQGRMVALRRAGELNAI